MPLTNGDIIVYDGTQWVNQKSVPGPFDIDPPTFHVDEVNNRVGIGTATPITLLTVNSNTNTLAAGSGSVLIDGDANCERFEGRSYAAPGGAVVFQGKLAGGTKAAPTATPADGYLGALGGGGYDGSTYTGNVGLIGVRSAQAFTPTARGSYLSFETTNIGTIVRSEKVRISDAGYVGIGTTSPVGHVPSRRALIIADTTNDALLEIWGSAGAKTLLQSVGGNVYLGSLAQGTGPGNVYVIYGNAAFGITVLGASGNVGLGTITPNSKLQVTGPIATSVTSVSTTPYTITANDSVVRVDTTAAAITVNLPTAAGITGRKYTVKQVAGFNTVTVSAAAGQTIDGAASYTLSALYKYVTIVSNGSNWDIVANN